MRIKKVLRFLMLLIFIIIATIVPFPMKFYKKDNLPSCEIEQIDKDFITSSDEETLFEEQKGVGGIHSAPTKNLLQESG